MHAHQKQANGGEEHEERVSNNVLVG